MNKKYRLLCIVMALSLLLCLCACGGGQSVDGNATSGQEIAGTDGAQDTQDVDNPEEPEDAEEEEPLPVIECRSLPAFTNNFNPFTATGDDAEAVGLVYSTLADSACRTVVPSEDGGYLVTYEIYDGVRFSDGRQMTADDVIYTLNIICDPMYTFAHPDGPARVIYGTDEYQTGYTPVYTYILSDLQNGVAPDGTYYPQEDSDLFAQALRDAGIRFVNEIIDYCAEQYADEKSMGALGVDARTVRDNEGYRTAFAMWCWQFASGLNNDGLFSTLGGGEYDLSVSGPTPADFWQAIFTTYCYDMSDQGIK
ncbi:MAG: hypothetical protein IJ072_04965, partial [Oscillospiraceae bacterium]|nr:hypothetical protein [Oscillospiraceae bacterium]